MSALTDSKSVKEFSSWLLELAGALQEKLHHLSGADVSFARLGYGVLMEVYGLRTRASILFNDSDNHKVKALKFSQDDLMSTFGRISRVVPKVNSLKAVNAIVLTVATFTVSLGEDREKVVNFLFAALCDEVAGWEVAFS